MTSSNFPKSPLEIESWANHERVTALEGGRRYAQSLILRAIGQSNPIRESLILKGGNALEFAYQPNRSTTDMDFSLIRHHGPLTLVINTLYRQLDTTLNVINDGYGTFLRLQSIRQNPPGEHMLFPTITARVAYALPNQPRQHERLISGKPGANVIPVEMSVNEVVCEWKLVSIGQDIREIRVATIEDIVAEKLRAILQQVIRNRHRNQDVLDIAVLLNNPEIMLNRGRIAEYLIKKCAARDINATRSAFLNPEVRHRAATGYDDLSNTVRHQFIEFDDAWTSVLQLVDSLDVPQ